MLIIGIAALIILPIAAFFAWKIYSKNKADEKLNTGFDRALIVLPQLELNLQPSNIESWVNDAQLKTNEISLREAGLVHQGYFVNRSSMRKLQVSLWQFKNIMTVALCENQQESENYEEELRADYSCQSIARLNNRSTLSISNAQNAQRLPSSAEHRVVGTTETDPIVIMRLIKSHIPSDAKLVPITNSQQLFVDAYEGASHVVWRSEHLYGNDVISLLEENSVQTNEALLTLLQSHGDSFMSQIYSYKVLERLGNTPNMDAVHWEAIRGKCVVVHEKMSAEDLSSALFQTLTGLTSEQEKELESLGSGGPISDPITSFQEYLDSFNNGDKTTKRIAKMQQPVRAEIYLPS